MTDRERIARIIGRRMAIMDGHGQQYELERKLDIDHPDNDGRFEGYNCEGDAIADDLIAAGVIKEKG